MLKISNSHWKFCPMNSPPLSCMHCTGQEGYWQSQLSWTCHIWVWLSNYQHGSVQLNSKPYQCKSMHWTQLVDHWLWLTMAQSNWWGLLPRVQSAPLVWVGDHNHGLLIYIFGNLCTSINQCDSAFWGDDLLIQRFTYPFFARMSHHLVEPFDGISYHWFGWCNFPIGLSEVSLI